MMAPMTTLKWSCHSLLESTSMYMETWMTMVSTKVIMASRLFFFVLFMLLRDFHYFVVTPLRGADGWTERAGPL